MHRQAPRPLTGVQRALADAAISASALRTALRERRRLGLSLRDMMHFLRSQQILAAGLRDNKYMRFRGKIFVDAFTPHWPSPAFSRMISVYAANAARPLGEAQDFVTYFALAITRRCVYRCAHCYAVRTLGQRDPLSREKLLQVVEEALAIGVGVLSLEGGEPLLRFDDLLAILHAVRGRANPFIATTGWGLTPERAAALAAAGLVGAQVSLDHHDAAQHNALRGNPRAFDTACRAIRLFREAGVFPIVAVCPTPTLLEQDGLQRHLELARTLGAGMLQVLDPMPAGQLLDAAPAGDAGLLSAAQLAQLTRFHAQANASRRYRQHPAVSVRAHVEEGCRYGCGLGGNQHCYVAATGDVTPCVYMHVSFGNVLDEPLAPIFRRMRSAIPHPVDGLCPVYAVAPALARARQPDDGPFLPAERVPELAEVISARGLPGLFRRAQRPAARGGSRAR